MVTVSFTLQEDYWEHFEVRTEDVEYLYNHLIETETPLTSDELLRVLVLERIQREKRAIETQRSAGGTLYAPKGQFELEEKLIFPALGWRRGEVLAIRPGFNPDLGDFSVIKVAFRDGEVHEYAAGLDEHQLNNPSHIEEADDTLDPKRVLDLHHEILLAKLEEDLELNEDFVRIAGRWFPRALLVDVNIGHLNLAEAVLDMAAGGPLPTRELLTEIELPADVNPKLLEFSVDLALEEDDRFDEVGPSGEVMWFLRRLEPQDVLQTPIYLRYRAQEYDRSLLSDEMRALELDLDDELSQIDEKPTRLEEVSIRLIYPHLRAGTLPLSSRIRHLFPTAYEAPRIQFTFVDGSTGEKFPAWVVRRERYVYGLQAYYEQNGFIPGSILRVRRSKKPGEVLINSDSQRSSREWVRTALVGSDNRLVFAMLKQVVRTHFDERMVVAIPDFETLDTVWERMRKERPPFEKVVVNTIRELAKTNPQGHVHASELYSALNIVMRCPPGPVLALLASRPWFVHVGDLHYRYNDSESE